MRLERVAKPDWADVERAFQRVKQKTGERWTLPFVFQRLAEGKAGLFHFVAEKHIAYMVCELYEQGEAPWMNVWILEGEGLERADECLPLIDGLARSIGAVAWRCTGRKGWKAIGLKPIATVYERAVI
jgi:hypothetical protein